MTVRTAPPFPGGRRPRPELPPKVIRQWLAAVAIGLLGLGVSVEPARIAERPAAFGRCPGVVKE